MLVPTSLEWMPWQTMIASVHVSHSALMRKEYTHNSHGYQNRGKVIHKSVITEILIIHTNVQFTVVA